MKGASWRAWVAGVLLLGVLAGVRVGAAQETIVAIRHGEKPPGGLGQLSCMGLNRALALPKVLIAKFGRPTAIYAPNPADKVNDWSMYGYSYVRPLMTIEPTAIQLGLPVHAQIGFMKIDRLQEALTAERYEDAVVFVAWEHAMLNRFAKQMLRTYGEDASAVPDWPNTDFDRIYVFTIARSGSKPRLTFKVDHEGLDGTLSDVCPGAAQ